MPAYMRTIITPQCQHYSCTRKATHEVFNSLNSKQATLCAQHAHALLRRLNGQ